MTDNERKTEEEYRLLAEESKEKFEIMEKKINSLEYVCKEVCGDVMHILSFIRILENGETLSTGLKSIRQSLINIMCDHFDVEQNIKINLEIPRPRESVDSMTAAAIARMFLNRVSDDDDVFQR